MKVGILTFHNAINYGAVLQAYALQQTVVALGAECEIIDYRCPAVEKQYRRKKIFYNQKPCYHTPPQTPRDFNGFSRFAKRKRASVYFHKLRLFFVTARQNRTICFIPYNKHFSTHCTHLFVSHFCRDEIAQSQIPYAIMIISYFEKPYKFSVCKKADSSSADFLII